METGKLLYACSTDFSKRFSPPKQHTVNDRKKILLTNAVILFMYGIRNCITDCIIASRIFVHTLITMKSHFVGSGVCQEKSHCYRQQLLSLLRGYLLVQR